MLTSIPLISSLNSEMNMKLNLNSGAGALLLMFPHRF